MISVHNLQKSFGVQRVLTGLEFVVSPGAVTLLVGSNGAGKTTALRLLAGLSDPDAGTVRIGGHDLHSARCAALARLSFLPQAPRFHPRLTVQQVADFYARLRGRTGTAVTVALGEWGLTDCARVSSGKLSGGMRQRLALAVFALADTPVLLLDEPGLSLDPEWRMQLQDFLTTRARAGCAVLVATHLLGEWEGHADRCLRLADGRCVGEIAPDQLRDAFFKPKPQPAGPRNALAACA